MPTSRKLTLLARASALSLLLILGSCETIHWGRGGTTEIEAVVANAVPCSSLEQITPSRRDTDITIGKLREQNAVIAAICGVAP